MLYLTLKTTKKLQKDTRIFCFYHKNSINIKYLLSYFGSKKYL